MKMKHAQKGFTLIEIMIVVAIIAILAAIAIPNFLAYRAQSQRNACIANQKAIANAAEAYSIKNGGAYPETVAKLCEASTGNDFLKSEPKCPCGGGYEITAPSGNVGLKVECKTDASKIRTGFAHTESTSANPQSQGE